MTPADRTRALVLAAIEEGAATAEDVARATGRSAAHLRAVLSRLASTGALVAERRGQTYYYRPTGQ